MIAEFAALAQIAITAYGVEQNMGAANTASTMAQQQQQTATALGETANTQAFQGASYDEQWMQMKELSQQLYGAKQVEPMQTPTPIAGPTLR